MEQLKLAWLAVYEATLGGTAAKLAAAIEEIERLQRLYPAEWQELRDALDRGVVPK